MPDTPERRAESILALDFGLRRIGVAVGQQITDSASPLGVIDNGPKGPDWKSLEKLVADWRPTRLVVGMPAHHDGAPSEISDAIKEFKRELQRFDRPVDAVDEFLTSHEASELHRQQRAAGNRRRISKDMIDSMAAVLISERWLHAAGVAIDREKDFRLV
jgi:putative Holliday junction resolvase